MRSATPDPVTVPAAAFAAATAALIGRPLGDQPLAVAVSGGPDSLALLLLAHAAFGDRVRVVTVDHGLRDASGMEATLVADRAAQLGLPHTTLRWAGPYPTANLQAAARGARYALMCDWCAARGIRWLATAHHRDDAAETLLLRLARGAGVGGLSGIRPRRGLSEDVTVLRPLLGAAKAELVAIVVAAGWIAADDPTNRATRFDRTQARALLAATPWLDPARLAASAAHLTDVEAALAWATDAAWRSRVVVAALKLTIDAADLPHDLARRLVRRAVATLAPGRDCRGDAVERLMLALAERRRATLQGIAFTPIDHCGTLLWHARRAPPRRRPAPDATGSD